MMGYGDIHIGANRHISNVVYYKCVRVNLIISAHEKNTNTNKLISNSGIRQYTLGYLKPSIMAHSVSQRTRIASRVARPALRGSPGSINRPRARGGLSP